MHGTIRVPIGLRIPRVPRISTRHYSTPPAIPFRITRKEANQIFASKRSLLEVAGEEDALVHYKTDPVKECFIPFHSADISNIKSSYVARYGKDRYETYWALEYNPTLKTTTPVLRTRVVIDWYNTDGTTPNISYPFGTPWSQIYAGFVYPRYLIESVLPTKNVDDLVPITSEMINFDGTKKIVYPHEMNIAFALEKINSELMNVEKKRVKSYIRRIHKADHVEIGTLDVHLDLANIDLHSYYIPAYIYQSDLESLSKYQIINANTGDINGNTIYSVFKAAVLGMGIGGVTALMFTAASRPYLLPFEIAARIFIGSSLTGLLSGIMANVSNTSTNREHKQQMQNDTNNNSEYIETDDDKERRYYSSMMNDHLEDTFKVNTPRGSYNLPLDKLKLLQLENAEHIDLEVLKKAYHTQMRKWHPDLHSDKRIVAENMTKQINVAYKDLVDTINKIDNKYV